LNSAGVVVISVAAASAVVSRVRKCARADRPLIARLPAVAREALGRERLVHHAVDRHTVPHQSDQRAPDRQAGDEGPRAVDRIEHPDIFGIGVLGAELLAEHAVPGELALDQMAHDHLAGPVALGHGVEHAAMRLVVGGVVGPEEGQDRLARFGRKLRNEGAEINDTHIPVSPERRAAQHSRSATPCLDPRYRAPTCRITRH
jgi:hypothetical protein